MLQLLRRWNEQSNCHNPLGLWLTLWNHNCLYSVSRIWQVGLTRESGKLRDICFSHFVQFVRHLRNHCLIQNHFAFGPGLLIRIFLDCNICEFLSKGIGWVANLAFMSFSLPISGISQIFMMISKDILFFFLKVFFIS